MSAADTQDDLSVLFPAAILVSVGGRDIDVTPLTLGELPALMKLIRAAGNTLAAAKFDPLILLAEHTDLAIELIAVLTRQEVEWLKGLILDDAAALLVAAIEANQSFFVRNGRALLAAVERAMAAAGRSPSPP